HSNESPQVRREVERAVSKGITIYPLVMENIELSKWMQYYISAHQWHDAIDVPLNRKLPELLGAIKSTQIEAEEAPDFSNLSAMLENDLASLSAELDFDEKETEHLLPGERRRVSVLHITTDLSDSEVSSSIQKTVSTTVTNLIARFVKSFGGYLDSKSLNSYLCIFGLEQALEDDNRRALSCGIRLFNSFGELNSVLRRKNLSIDFGLGVSSGMLEVDKSGGENSEPEGEALLQAQELSQSASNELLATRLVYQTTRDQLPWEEHSKGIYRISDYSITAPNLKILSMRSPFVGREEEISKLSSLLKQQNTGTDKNRLGGSKHLVMGIRGEAGIGKSRLVYEFLDASCKDANGYLVLKGQTLSYAQPPYWLWTTLLRNLLAIEHGSGLSYSEFLERLCKLSENEDLQKSAPFLAELLSIKSGDIRLEKLGNKAIALETRMALRNLLKTLSAERTLVIVLEDLHWIDESDRTVLEFVASNSNTESPIVFLLVYRPEREDGTTVEFNISPNYAIAEEIEVVEVDEKASSDFIQQLLEDISETNTNQVTPEVYLFLLERSRGNPFYLEELVLNLVESGVLAENGNEWYFSSAINELFVPDSLIGLLQSRLDRLPESWRSVLQNSSVLGMEFQLKLYRKLSDKLLLGRPRLETFDGLERKQMLLSEKSAFEKKYLFHHILVHDTAYSSILKGNLKKLHKAAAETIEELFQDEEEKVSGILMHHYEKAGEKAKAIDWGVKALRQLVKYYSNEEALELSNRLESMLGEQPVNYQQEENLFEVLSNREKVLDLLGKREEQEPTLARMVEIAEKGKSDTRLVLALRALGDFVRITGRMDEARSLYEKALEIAREVGNRSSEGRVLGNLGVLHKDQGRMDEARSLCENALEIHREVGD
ncbi:MAG: AAA family ATPase, partial [Candidatus Thorarchaeota archaeon]